MVDHTSPADQDDDPKMGCLPLPRPSEGKYTLPDASAGGLRLRGGRCVWLNAGYWGREGGKDRRGFEHSGAAVKWQSESDAATVGRVRQKEIKKGRKESGKILQHSAFIHLFLVFPHLRPGKRVRVRERERERGRVREEKRERKRLFLSLLLLPQHTAGPHTHVNFQRFSITEGNPTLVRDCIKPLASTQFV